MDMPDRVGQALLEGLPFVGFEELLILVDVAGDDVEIETLRRPWLAIHEQRKRFRRGVAQPFLDRQPVAPRLGNLLALLIEEQLKIKAFRRRAAERPADLARPLDRVDQVLARLPVTEPKPDPANAPA